MKQLNSGYYFALAAALIWSGFILVSRLGGISELNGYDVIAIRYLTCTMIVLPIWWFKFRFKLFTKRLWVCSMIGGLAYAMFTFQGFQMASAAHAAILLPGMMPIFIMICAVLINGERPCIHKWLAIVIITIGVAALFWPIMLSTGSLSQGHLLLIGGSLCWAIFSVLIKRWEITPWQATVSLAVLTCLVYMPYYLVLAPKKINIELWQDIALQAFYQGFLATIVQMIFYVRAVQLIGPSSMGATMAIVPLISGISAIFLFSEPASTSLFSGLLLVSLGSFIMHININFWRKNSALRQH
ncbi:MAG: drug/metabolite transporter (DMT)-like permease [Oceanospirillaceae bacterium]|jgi:drug/metabolite transporter (DMT)-like permease